jgi:arylsulfatase A-like enzyme
LKQAGYHTIHCGKAHFAPYGTPASNPLTVGFDVNIAGTAAGHPGSFLAKDKYKGNPNDTLWGVRGLEKHAAKGTFLTDALTEEAIAAMQANEKTGKPFFLYMAHYAVHLPFNKDDRFYQHYIDKGLTDTEAKYAALVEGMDKSLGELMDYLKQRGQDKNTIVVFMTDNGSLSLVPPRTGKVHTQNLPLKQGKGSLYEGGIRVPMIVAGPGIQANSTNHQYVSIDDWFPTLLELAGSKAYRTVQTIDGKSIVPFLKNPNRKDDKKVLLWHYPNNWTNVNYHGISWGTAMRKGNWKLVYFHKTGELELYDLSKDIGEEHDLATVQPAKLREMTSLMTNTLKKRNASMPTFKQTGQQIPWPNAASN